jgi:hypothetical protein
MRLSSHARVESHAACFLCQSLTACSDSPYGASRHSVLRRTVDRGHAALPIQHSPLPSDVMAKSIALATGWEQAGMPIHLLQGAPNPVDFSPNPSRFLPSFGNVSSAIKIYTVSLGKRHRHPRATPVAPNFQTRYCFPGLVSVGTKYRGEKFEEILPVAFPAPSPEIPR